MHIFNIINITLLAVMPAIILTIRKKGRVFPFVPPVLLLVAIHLYRVYGFSNNIIFANSALIMFFLLLVFDWFGYLDKNELINKTKVKALAKTQHNLKIYPFKYNCIKISEEYLLVFGYLCFVTIFLNIFGAMSSQFMDFSDSAFTTQAPLSFIQINKTNIAAMIGILMSVGLYFILSKIRKKMLPIFWRAQLLPAFDPLNENIKIVAEITDKEYIKKIFEVNDFLLVTGGDKKRTSEVTQTLEYLSLNYPLNILRKQPGVYVMATTIGINKDKDLYRFYFIKFNFKDEEPPTNSQELKTDTNKTKTSEGVVPHAI